MNFQNPPEYMESGSTGPIVDEVLTFLDKWATKRGLAKEEGTGIVLDQTYGDTGVRWMKEYQGAHGIGVDGGCGPTTRMTMLKDGFDFAEASRKKEALSCYVQPDGRRLYWTYGIQADEDQLTAQRRFEKAYHGN